MSILWKINFEEGVTSMQVKQMIELLRTPEKIQFRNSDNYQICITASDSEGIIPYMDRKIKGYLTLSVVLDNHTTSL